MITRRGELTFSKPVLQNIVSYKIDQETAQLTESKRKMGREIATMMLQRPECKAIANTAVALKLSLVFGLLLVPQIASQSSSHPTAGK